MRIRSTYLKKFIKMPEEGVAAALGVLPETQATPAMQTGSILHAQILEKNILWTPKEHGKGRQFSLDGEGKILLNPETIKSIIDIDRAVCPVIDELLDGAVIEKDFICDYDINYYLTAKPDFLKDNCIYDLKTVTSSLWRNDADGWRWAASYNGWDLQMAHYAYVLEQNGYKNLNACIIAVLKEPPHSVAFLRFGGVSMACARDKHRHVLEEFVAAVEDEKFLLPKTFEI